jgi:hypothetical protein
MRLVMNENKVKWGKGAAFALVVLLTVGCGSNNNVAAPAPPAQYPGYTYNTSSGACGNPGGTVPLQQNGTPYASTLSTTGGNASNTLSLYLFYYGSYAAGSGTTQNIVGSGTFTYPDLTLFSPSSSIPNYTFCISSSQVNGNSPTPGVYQASTQGISLSLRGLVSVPYLSPYSGTSGVLPGQQPPYGQEQVELDIGTSYCGAYLYNGRVVGCSQVTLGISGQSPIIYQMQ